jgi:hypothetical protein
MTSQTIERRIHWKLNGEPKVSACANSDPRNARPLISREISLIATSSIEKATNAPLRRFLIVKAGPCLRTV